jgi:hypothetical protein
MRFDNEFSAIDEGAVEVENNELHWNDSDGWMTEQTPRAYSSFERLFTSNYRAAIAGSTAEAADKVIAAKTIASTSATITVAADKCAGGKPGTSETNDNCKNNCGTAQH